LSPEVIKFLVLKAAMVVKVAIVVRVEVVLK
jgi:hypothetical protein